MIDLATIDKLVPDTGVIDVACPICGPERRSPINRRRKVLRVWRLEPGFATYHCARCGVRATFATTTQGRRFTAPSLSDA